MPVPENLGRTKKLQFIHKESIVYESVGQQFTNTPDELKADMKRLYVTVARHVVDEIRRRFTDSNMIKYMEALEAADPTSSFFGLPGPRETAAVVDVGQNQIE